MNHKLAPERYIAHKISRHICIQIMCWNYELCRLYLLVAYACACAYANISFSMEFSRTRFFRTNIGGNAKSNTGIYRATELNLVFEPGCDNNPGLIRTHTYTDTHSSPVKGDPKRICIRFFGTRKINSGKRLPRHSLLDG